MQPKYYLSVLLASIVVVVSSTSSFKVEAEDLGDYFEEMTMQTGGAGQYSAGGRTIHSGGYVRIRIPTEPAPNPIKIQPPSMRGGCNGFDLYGGSFSMIEEEELMSWLNAVVENGGALATYMFMTFLQEQCAVCSEVMNVLYSMQDFLNVTMQDSCTTATHLIEGMRGGGPGWESYKQGIVNSASKVGSTFSTLTDAAAIRKKGEESPQDVAAAAAGNADDRARTLTGGNPLYMAIRDGGLLNKYKKRRADLSTLTENQLYVYLTGMAGSLVKDLKMAGETNAGDAQFVSIEPFISIRSLIDANFNDKEFEMACESATSCLRPTNVSFKDGYGREIKSFADTMSCMMKGVDVNGAVCGSTGGLLNKIGARTSEGAMTAEEREFFLTFSPRLPVMAMLQDVSTSVTAKQTLYECMKERLVNEFAFTEIMFALTSVRDALADLAVTGTGQTVRDEYRDSVIKRIAIIESEFSSLTYDAEKTCDIGGIENFNTIKEMIKTTQPKE